MRIVQAREFGSPEVLDVIDAPAPIARAYEVIIDVAFSEILYLDTQLRGGWGQEFFDANPPYTPGTGVAGIVSAVGTGADAQWIDRRAVARTGDFGGYAERVAVPKDAVFPVPDDLDLPAAIAALHDGPTALSRLEKARLKPGDTVLVNAAGGGLAAWLIPIARERGAWVIGAARGEEKLEAARKHGADAVGDYSEPEWPQKVRELTDRLNVVFDGAGGAVGTAAYRMLADGGRFFSYGAAAGTFASIDSTDARRRRITVVPVTDPTSADDERRLTLEALARLSKGSVRPMIGQTYPLERAAEAHRAIENRLVAGKSLLTV